MKRTISMIMMFCLMLCIGIVPVNAAYIPEVPIEHTDMGPATHFGSASNYPIRSRAMWDILYEREFTKQNQHFHYKAVDKGNYNANGQFVKYLTTAWQRTPEYTGSYSVTISAQIQSGIVAEVTAGITASLGVSMSISETAMIGSRIEADKTRDSKLGLTADFYVQQYDYYYWLNDVIITQRLGGENKYPTGDYYLRVMYK